MIRFDMSEYMEKYSVLQIGQASRLCRLWWSWATDWKSSSQSLLTHLLDEVEKATDVCMFLQVLDDGRLTDG